MVSLILLITLINLADYGGPVAIYFPQSKSFPVFIPIKNYNFKQTSIHGFSEIERASDISSSAGVDTKVINETPESNFVRINNDKLAEEKTTKSVQSDVGGNSDVGTNHDENDEDDAKNVDQLNNSNESAQKSKLLTSSSHQTSTINQLSDSAVNQLLFNSLDSSGDSSSLKMPFDEGQSGQHEFTNDGNTEDDDDEKAKSLEKLIAEAEDKRPDLLSSTSSSSSGETFLPSHSSADSVSDVGISSSLMSHPESSASLPSFSPFANVVNDDNQKGFSLSSLFSSFKPFQSMTSSTSSNSNHIRGVSPSSSSSPTLSDSQKFQSLLNSNAYYNLGDANLASLGQSSKSVNGLSLNNDMTGSLQQALSASLPASSLSSQSLSPSSSLPSFLNGLNGLSPAPSSNDFLSMLSLFQQLNENTMSSDKEELNLSLLKPLFTGNLPSMSSSPGISSTSSSNSPSSTTFISPNGQKTRTIILPIFGDSLFQSANPFYDAFLQSLTASASSSSSASLPPSSSLKLFQDGLTSNTEMSLDGATNGQSNMADLNSLAGSLSGSMDDQSLFTGQAGSLVDTSSLGKSHSYVVVDEEFNANGLGLPQGYKPDLMGILAGPPCVDTPSTGNQAIKGQPEKLESSNDKKPACPYHHHHHHHPEPDQQNSVLNKDRENEHEKAKDRDLDRDRNQNPSKDSYSHDNSNKPLVASPKQTHHHHHHHNNNHNHPHHSHEPHGTKSHHFAPDYNRPQADEDKEKHLNHHHHSHVGDKPMFASRNRTSFRSVPFIKGSFRYKPDASNADD